MLQKPVFPSGINYTPEERQVRLEWWGEKWDAYVSRKPKCSWVGCENKADWMVPMHEGPHPDDEFDRPLCPYHEAETWYIDNVKADIGYSLGFVDPSGMPY